MADDLEKLYSAYHATVAHGKGRVQEATSRCSKRKKKPSQAQGQAGELVSGEVADEQAPDGTHVNPSPVEQVWNDSTCHEDGATSPPHVHLDREVPAVITFARARTEPLAHTPMRTHTLSFFENSQEHAWFADRPIGGSDCWHVDGAVECTGDAIWDQHRLSNQWQHRFQDQPLDLWQNRRRNRWSA